MQLRTFCLTPRTFGEHFDLVTGMHRLRARVFKDRLDWEVSVAGDMEMDLYDAENATYLLVVTETREVVGHVRLLPTLGPNMLADTFPILLDGAPAPCSSTIIESSRFCVDTGRASDLAGHGMRQATFLLFTAILEWCLDNDYRTVATVTDTRMERILRRAGWPLQRLGAPQLIGETEALAGLLAVTPQIRDMLRGTAGRRNPLITPATLPMAA